MRIFIADGARRQTWDNISRWVTCIRNLKQITKWSEIEQIDKNYRKCTLRSICAMNLKKSPGVCTTNAKSLKAAINEDKEFILKQYNIYDADITVCCGTGWYLQSILDLNDNEVFETTKGIKWFKNKQNKPVFIFAHPAARVQSSFIVYGLVDAIQEVLSSESAHYFNE